MGAVQEIEDACAASNTTTRVFSKSCDVTDYEALKVAVKEANAFHGRDVDELICCAGYARPGYFMECDVEIFENEMNVNFFGCLYAAKAVAPYMVERGTGGRIAFVSSACGTLSFIGYTQYCSTKYAVRGLAEALRNELILYDIDVNIFYAANIDTAGYETENKTKPKETADIEGAGDLVSPDAAAQSLIDGFMDDRFAITNDIGCWLLRSSSAGAVPRNNFILEFLLSPLTFLASAGFRQWMDFVVRQSSKRKEHKARTLN